MFRAAGLFAFVRKMPNISTGVGCLLCLLMLDWRSAVGQMLCLGITCVVLASTRLCLVNLRDNTGKVGPNLWLLNLVQTRISGAVFDGASPNVLTLNRLTSSCYRWWTFWIELDNIRSKSLLLRTETPVMRPAVFLCAAESFTVDVQDGLVV